MSAPDGSIVASYRRLRAFGKEHGAFMFVTLYGLAAVSWAWAYHTGLLIRHKGEIERLEIRYEGRISRLEINNKFLEEAKADLKKQESSARRAHERDVGQLRRQQEELRSALASARQQVGHLLQGAPARASGMGAAWLLQWCMAHMMMPPAAARMPCGAALAAGHRALAAGTVHWQWTL
jgi:hypothetical protein